MMKVTANDNGTATIHNSYTSKTKLKLMVQMGNQSCSYNIGEDLTVPLQFGNGAYQFLLCEQKTGNHYRVKERVRKAVKQDETAYMLSPNVYVPYAEESSFYAKAQELGTLENIRNFLRTKFRYDYIKAITVARNKMSAPDLEQTFTTQVGICWELAALATAMLRICGIPAALVGGIAKIGKHSFNHAWVEVNGQVYDPTKEIQHKKTTYTYVEQKRF